MPAASFTAKPASGACAVPRVGLLAEDTPADGPATVRAAVGQLAVGAIDRPPGLGESQDRLPLGGHRDADRPAPRWCAAGPTVAPRSTSRPSAVTGIRDRTVVACTRRNASPVRKIRVSTTPIQPPEHALSHIHALIAPQDQIARATSGLMTRATYGKLSSTGSKCGAAAC